MQLDDCLFCRIARGEIPSNKIYEDDDVLAFRDINPRAPVHFFRRSTCNLLLRRLPKTKRFWVKC